MFRMLTKRKADDTNAYAIYRAIMAQARHRNLYTSFGVPDTLDGRFEMLVLHATLVMSRLREAGTPELAQRVFDIMFNDMDQALRETGASDISVPRKVRQMAEAFYGRAAAYSAALQDTGKPASLAEALARNVFPDGCQPGKSVQLARYAAEVVDALSRTTSAAIIDGLVEWPVPTEGPAEGISC